MSTAPGGYYGRPVLKEPVWRPEVALYFFFGGLAGMSAVLAFAARVTGRDRLARGALLGAFAGVIACPPLLVLDLGRPERFLNMLRVLKPTSPMSIGSWILVASGATISTAAASEVTGIARPLGRAAEVLAALLGLPLSVYAGVLLADTSIPAWHEARRHLPFLFGGSAAASAGAAAAILTPAAAAGPARRLAVLGCVIELLAARAQERRLGADARHYHGKLDRAAKLLTASGGLLMALGGRRRPIAATAGAAILGGSLCERFAVLAAGPRSARATAAGGTVRAPEEAAKTIRGRIDGLRRH